MTTDEALEFVRQHGVVLESARGPVPSLAATVVGGPLEGNWWGHPRGHQIFGLTRALRDSADVLVCRLVDGKITYVHRRLWSALARLADQLDADRLAVVREVHTAQGKHRVDVVAFDAWLPADVRLAAKRLSVSDAAAALGGGLQIGRTPGH